MKNIIISTLVFFVAIPFVSLAQKAYENIIYTGYLNGRKITFLLADGYIGASIITLQSSRVGKINFNPEFLSADKNGNLKFLHYLTQNKASKSYFVLFGISDMI